jgi:SWI/SNF-related matrix-associated actin-dependent regulator 1 of chromatin subfamily A
MSKEYQLRRDPTTGLFYAVFVEDNTTEIVKGRDFEDQYKNFSAAVKPLPAELIKFAKSFNDYHLQNKNKQTVESSLSLYPHQKTTFQFIFNNTHCINALDVGLGKTLCLIALLNHIYTLQQGHLRALIIMPAGLIDNWVKELTMHVPHLKINRIQHAKTASFDAEGVTLMSEALLAPLKKQIKAATKFDILSVDEAHLSKNKTSERSKALYFVAGNTNRTVLLSATPSMTHLQWYGLVRVLHPVFKSFFHFQPFGIAKTKSNNTFYYAVRYCGPEYVNIGRGKKVWQFKRETRAEELQALLSPFLIHMKKEDVIDLPPLLKERIIVGSLCNKQRKEFTSTLAKVKEMRDKSTLAANAMLMELVRDTMRLKTPFVVNHIQTLLVSQAKFVCFVHHRFLSEAIQTMLVAENVQFININGETDKKLRTTLLKQFESDSNVRVAILTFGTCAAGLNITFANLCVFCERTFDATLQEQAEGRLHRINQKLPVTLLYLDLQYSTDTLLDNTVKRKVASQAFILGGESDNPAKKRICV